MVVLVEVHIKSYLASMVPVIVNAILNDHQVVVDIVAFVGKGDFPRSRLGEKQRGKILASWVTRKMRTIAQFGIRDTPGRREEEELQRREREMMHTPTPVDMPAELPGEMLVQVAELGASPVIPERNPRRASAVSGDGASGFLWAGEEVGADVRRTHSGI